MSDLDVWVFGYGSLIWNPEFSVAERQLASVTGFRRAFCMRSIHLRGTATDPGLVLALDAQNGATCRGVALRIEPGTEDASLAALRDRELRASAYDEKQVPLDLDDGRRIEAIAYIVDPRHDLYCAHTLEEQAQIIATARGERGPNRDYLMSTFAHLQELGIEDDELKWLANRISGLDK